MLVNLNHCYSIVIMETKYITKDYFSSDNVGIKWSYFHVHCFYPQWPMYIMVVHFIWDFGNVNAKLPVDLGIFA